MTIRAQRARLHFESTVAYFFFDAFFDLPLALVAFAPLADDLVLFFLPKADAQLLLYRLLGPLRKIVIGISGKVSVTIRC